MSQQSRPVAHRNITNGQWKVDEPAGSEIELTFLAKELAEGPDGHNYLMLDVRGSGKNQWAILFKYQYDGTKAGHDKYFRETRDMLIERYGEDNVHWDVSSTIVSIK